MNKFLPALTAAFLTALSIPSLLYAQETSPIPEPEIKKYGLIDPPACILPSGEKIQTYPGTSEQIVQFGGFLAAAGDFEVGKDGGVINEYRIYYDESNMPFLHPLLQEFFFYHECAHIQLSHHDIPTFQRVGKYWEIEQGADCVAFAEIKKESENFSYESALILTHFGFIANIMMSSAPGSEESRKEFINQRIENMETCPALEK